VIQQLDSPPYTVDRDILRRFDQRQTVFARSRSDAQAGFYGKSVHENAAEAIASNRPGYSRMDFARSRAAWTVCDHFHGAYSWERLDSADPVAERLGQMAVTDVAAISQEIRKTASMYGADLVGICELDRGWVYSRSAGANPVEIPPEFEHAIVMAVRMDAAAIRTSPAFSAAAAVGVGYSRMAFSIACLAEFIRSLGYRAIPMGNDTALSIPLAIDAGLGELGRNGLLITPQYGPCVRLCKVFTDLPLEAGKPIEFGVTDFCRRCGKCAEACEAGAISSDPEPSFATTCPSNNPGILRWAVNKDKCYSFWVDNGGDCSTCIAVCPFTSRPAVEAAEPPDH
jgi:epoxyqueuosine reductase